MGRCVGAGKGGVGERLRLCRRGGSPSEKRASREIVGLGF